MAVAATPTTRRLLIGDLPPDFNPARDIALGPWVFASSLDDHPDWYEHDFPDPSPDEESLTKAYRCCEAIFWEVLPRQADNLAEVMGGKFDLRMEAQAWQYFVAPWVQCLVFLTWSRYWLVRSALDRIGGQPALVHVPARNPRPLVTTGAEILAMVSAADETDRWITGRAVECLRHLCPGMTIVEEAWQPAPRTKIPQGWRPDSRLRRLLGRSPQARFLPVSGVGLPWAAAFNAVMAVRRVKSGPLPNMPDSPRAEWPEGFAELLDQALDVFRPDLSHMLDDAVLADIKAQRHAKGAMRFNPPDYWNDHRRLSNAMALSAGEILVGAQHGGMYGIQEPNTRPQVNEFAFSDFLTWGWSSCGAHWGRFHPLPSPMVSRLAKRHRRRSDDIILVLSKNMYGGEGMFWTRSLKGAASHHRDCLKLIEGVKTLDGNPVIRYFHSFAAEIPLPADSVAGMEILKGPLWQRALSSKLMISSAYGTPMHEALAAGVPFLQLMTSSPLPVAPEARAHMDRLRSAGIVHDSVDALMAMAHRILPDVNAWWSSPEVRSARDAFVHEHARHSRIWGLHWLKWFLTR